MGGGVSWLGRLGLGFGWVGGGVFLLLGVLTGLGGVVGEQVCWRV